MEMTNIFGNSILSPKDELFAYEYLWAQQGSSLKDISNKLTKTNYLPSEVLQNLSLFKDDELMFDIIKYITEKKKETKFSIMLKENFQFPQRLLNAENPIDLFYYKGNLNLTNNRCISIVGARKATNDGIKRANKLAYLLTKNNFTIVSGLALGIDTAAMTTAIKEGGSVIGVIGTPITEYYPKENKDLQDFVANNHLLISQVPIYKYSKQPFKTKRLYFPERNITMAALSEATVIVEASDTSGSLTQARACFNQGKKLFILNSCFENPDITWPRKYLEKGAICVKNIEDILKSL